MTTKKKRIEKIYVIVPAITPISFSNLKEAEVVAKDECRIGGQDMQILEVTRAWYVEIPEEPEPEIAEDTLEDLIG